MLEWQIPTGSCLLVQDTVETPGEFLCMHYCTKTIQSGTTFLQNPQLHFFLKFNYIIIIGHRLLLVTNSTNEELYIHMTRKWVNTIITSSQKSHSIEINELFLNYYYLFIELRMAFYAP